MAILLGLYDSDNYNWRSMTSPGITGLFNEYCLQAGADNLMKCYPGDNTYTLANTNPETVSLINEDNQFHSLTTTVDTNGKSRHQARCAGAVRWSNIRGELGTVGLANSIALRFHISIGVERIACGVVWKVPTSKGCRSFQR